jgi:hypothetical protein
MRHAEGDLAGPRVAFDAALADPDAATRAAAVAYLGLLLGHGDRFAAARRLLDRSIRACRASWAVPAHAHLLLRGHPGLRQPRRPSGRTAAPGHAGAPPRRGRGRFYHARAATAGSWLWRELGEPGRSRDLAGRAMDLLGPDATGTHPGLHAQLALAECALVAGDQAEAAARVAGRAGSDYLLAQVAPPAQARAALERIAAALPAELRPAFLARGFLATATPRT